MKLFKDLKKRLQERNTTVNETTSTTEKRKYTKRVPHTNKDIVIHIRLTEEEYKAVSDLAQSLNVSVSQLTRAELNDAVERKKRSLNETV